MRAPPPGQPHAAAYVLLRNHDRVAHKLVKARAAIASKVELHAHLQISGMMSMRRVDAIEVAPGQETHLEPGGAHLMLFDLARALRVGERIPIELFFEDGSRSTVEVEVQAK